MSKVPCRDCGRLVMEATFKNNDGLCMPCSNGFKCSSCGQSTLSGQQGLCSNCFRKCPPPQKECRATFDHNLMLCASLEAIKNFAQEHPTGVFYCLAIDANMLCLNSVEEYEKTLLEYKQAYSDYRNNAQKREKLKMNTGDWKYQGFFDLTEEDGFCQEAYDDHYYLAAEDLAAAQTSLYAVAMDRLLDAIRSSDVLNQLKRTDDFTLKRVDHVY